MLCKLVNSCSLLQYVCVCVYLSIKITALSVLLFFFLPKLGVSFRWIRRNPFTWSTRNLKRTRLERKRAWIVFLRTKRLHREFGIAQRKTLSKIQTRRVMSVILGDGSICPYSQINASRMHIHVRKRANETICMHIFIFSPNEKRPF